MQLIQVCALALWLGAEPPEGEPPAPAAAPVEEPHSLPSNGVPDDDASALPETSADAPTRATGPVGLTAEALTLRDHLRARRAQLIEEQRPSLRGPISLMSLSAATALLGVIALYAAQMILPYSVSWIPSVVLFAGSVTMGVTGSILLPKLLSAGEQFDGHPPSTAVDGDLAAL